MTAQPASRALSTSSLRLLVASMMSCLSVASSWAFWSDWSWSAHRPHVASVPEPLPPVGNAVIATTVVVAVAIGLTGPVPLVLATAIGRLIAGRDDAVSLVLVAADAPGTADSAARTVRVLMQRERDSMERLLSRGLIERRSSPRAGPVSVTPATDRLYRPRS